MNAKRVIVRVVGVCFYIIFSNICTYSKEKISTNSTRRATESYRPVRIDFKWEKHMNPLYSTILMNAGNDSEL